MSLVSRLARRLNLPLLAIIGLGACLRLPTLGRQSFWVDELRTVWILRQGFDEMLNIVPGSEATPYLYYVLAWGWTHLFGHGEIAVRSMSALFGLATIWIAYAIGTTLVSRRCGQIAALLVAVNPFLVYYSQEARSYALLCFTAALSFLCFAHAVRGSRRALIAWAAASALAVASHYFAIFVVFAEAVWLLRAYRPRWLVLASGAAPVLVLAAHAPLLLEQRTHAWGKREPLQIGPPVGRSSFDSFDAGFVRRLVGVPKGLVVGYSFPFELLGSLFAALLVIVGLVLAVRGVRRGSLGQAILAGFVSFLALIIPVLLVLIGEDYVLVRNEIGVLVPAIVFLAAGYSSSRGGLVTGGALALLSTAIVLGVAHDDRYWRNDWRGAGAVVAAGEGRQVVVLNPPVPARLWRPYLRGLHEIHGETVIASEIVVIGLPNEGYTTGVAGPPDATVRTPPPGFRVVESARTNTFAFVRYRSDRPRSLTTSALTRLRIGRKAEPGFLIRPTAIR